MVVSAHTLHCVTLVAWHMHAIGNKNVDWGRWLQRAAGALTACAQRMVHNKHIFMRH